MQLYMSFPDSLSELLDIPSKDLDKELKFIIAGKLYDMGKITLEEMLDNSRQPGALQDKALAKMGALKAKAKKKETFKYYKYIQYLQVLNIASKDKI